jgi:putative ATP-dependent endonuclease of OLD family
MVTTHSPAFLDISRDNTTIVRVERNERGVVSGTTVFRPSRIQLTEDDKQRLKLLNHWDPYVAEFFFGGRTIVVEGDTEYSAFREIIEEMPSTYKNVHIVRARGKFVIPALVRILNHFGSRYAVLHDSDSPYLPSGKKNAAFSANYQILEAVDASPRRDDIRLATCVPNFEMAVFGHEVEKDKPFNAVIEIKNNAIYRANVKEMLDYLVFDSDHTPSCLTPWNAIEGLYEMFKSATSSEADSKGT